MASSLKEVLRHRINGGLARKRKRPKKKEPFMGKWVMWSDKDPRWNAEGTSEIGGDRMPDEVKAKADELKKTLGEPPDDLNWTYKLD